MTVHGVVLDARNPAGRPPIAELAPFRMVRLTAFADEQVYSYARQLRVTDVEIVAVITLEVIGEAPLEERAAEIARNLPADIFVLGNEPDALYNVDENGEPHPSPASDLMHEVSYGVWAAAIARGIQSVRPDARMCVAGMVSGQPWAAWRYVDALRQRGVSPSMIDLHLYATAPAELPAKLAAYRAGLPGLDFCMFEWSAEASDIPEMVRAIEREQITADCYHAWHETDIEGLHDELGRRTPRYYALVDAINAPEVAMPEYEFNPAHDFARFAREHSEVGAPLSEEVTLGTAQLAEGGLLVYLNPPAALTVLLPWGTIDHPPESLPPAGYVPVIEEVKGNVVGSFATTPKGVILHGTRSGQNYDTEREYQATVNYVRNGAGGLGWHCTIGDDKLAIHQTAGVWAWNARGASGSYLAVEFAQASVDRPISDAQVRAFAWFFLHRARAAWSKLPMEFPMHSELSEGISDGKSDVFPRGDARGDELRARIRAEIARQGG